MPLADSEEDNLLDELELDGDDEADPHECGSDDDDFIEIDDEVRDVSVSVDSENSSYEDSDYSDDMCTSSQVEAPYPSSVALVSGSDTESLSTPPLISPLAPELMGAGPRTLSPAEVRRKALMEPIGDLVLRGSYTVEAICAIPHPVPTHALAASACMRHLLTGSEDGHIRDYDIYESVNGKNFLTAPQRHHTGVVEGIVKSAQLHCWWLNPGISDSSRNTNPGCTEEQPFLAPVYSLVMHSDALWTLAGTDEGSINLFTVRHEPGLLIQTMNGHRGPVSALAMNHDERGFFSAGWDGEAIQWDLNAGQRVRNFTSHGAQLAAISVRPLTSTSSKLPSLLTGQTQNDIDSESQRTKIVFTLFPGTTGNVPRSTADSDAKSDGSFDPLFDDDPEAQEMADTFLPVNSALLQPIHSRPIVGQIPPPKNIPPVLDSATYASYSSDILMTASIDGQVILWDRRVESFGFGVGRLWTSEKTPPWCLSACWSADGGQLYAGRRNGTVDIWDVRQLGQSGSKCTPRLFKTLRNPPSSGVVSCVVAFPDCHHIACASIDNIRLWDISQDAEETISKAKSGAQFKIIPGHHGGYISQMLLDSRGRFLVSSSSNRGWHGDSTKTVFVHDIKRSCNGKDFNL